MYMDTVSSIPIVYTYTFSLHMHISHAYYTYKHTHWHTRMCLLSAELHFKVSYWVLFAMAQTTYIQIHVRMKIIINSKTYKMQWEACCRLSYWVSSLRDPIHTEVWLERESLNISLSESGEGSDSFPSPVL